MDSSVLLSQNSVNSYDRHSTTGSANTEDEKFIKIWLSKAGLVHHHT